MTTKKEMKEFEKWAVLQLKDTLKMNEVDLGKTFKFQLTIKYSKVKDKTNVGQEFRNGR